MVLMNQSALVCVVPYYSHSENKSRENGRSHNSPQHSTIPIPQLKPMLESKSKVLLPDPMLERGWGSNIQALVSIIIMVVVVVDIDTVVLMTVEFCRLSQNSPSPQVVEPQSYEPQGYVKRCKLVKIEPRGHVAPGTLQSTSSCEPHPSNPSTTT